MGSKIKYPCVDIGFGAALVETPEGYGELEGICTKFGESAKIIEVLSKCRGKHRVHAW